MTMHKLFLQKGCIFFYRIKIYAFASIIVYVKVFNPWWNDISVLKQLVTRCYFFGRVVMSLSLFIWRQKLINMFSNWRHDVKALNIGTSHLLLNWQDANLGEAGFQDCKWQGQEWTVTKTSKSSLIRSITSAFENINLTKLRLFNK